ncbi:MAG: 1-acyl-sn-glycerol-3-phosphate acyltransferase [Clostridia bacterium]|nr:1-acyl-sn-glycerol-3-phosphate acyltransferase [Clostridia bacterium]
MTKKREERKKPSLAYRFVKWNVRLFYPKIKCTGVENIPQEPVVLISNHAQIHGPIAYELYAPVERYTWCNYEMMERKEIPAYAFRDFWSYKPKRTHRFYKILAHAITPLAVLIFNNADTVPVYRDRRVTHTLRRSVALLEEGKSLTIFPERDEPHNNVVYDFQEGFVDVARLYYKRTGQALKFVPCYLTPELKTISVGQPLAFDPSAPAEEERKRVCAELMERITALAEALPPHTVIPYRNVPKDQRPRNREE